MIKKSYFAGIALAVLCACSPPTESPDMASKKEPVASESAAKPAPPVSADAEIPSGHPPIPTSPDTDGAISAGGAQKSFSYELPEAWEDLGPSALRVVNLKLPEGGECYVTVLSGGAGGVGANVNRWRKQLELEDLSEEEIAGLPTIPMLGGNAQRVRATGTFRGMSGGVTQENYGLIGAVFSDPEETVFVKLLGPDTMLAGQEAAFDAFCVSLTRVDAPVPEAGMPAGHPPVGDPGAGAGTMPSGHPPIGAQGMPSTITPESIAKDALTYTVPATWTKAEDRPIRFATFSTPDGKAECYITVLSGNAGGTEANINLWRGQLGQEPLSAIEIAALPTIQVLDRECPLVEIEGSYTSMDGEAVSEALLLGTICTLERDAAFVKMVGPKESVAPERDAFRAFCESLVLADE